MAPNRKTMEERHRAGEHADFPRTHCPVCERPRGCCYDCGRRYGDEYGFPDLVVPHDIWKLISPTGDDRGLLCPSCMCRRAHDAGLSDVPARFMSGPFCIPDEALVASSPSPPPSQT